MEDAQGSGGSLSPSLKLDDLNHIIKLFSFSIQDRIDELDSVKPTAAYKRTPEQSDASILEKYHNYRIENIKEIKYIQKFCQRILEIFSYFKNRSRNPTALQQYEEKMVNEMDAILTKHPIALDSLLGFVTGFVKRPFLGRRKPLQNDAMFLSALNNPNQSVVPSTNKQVFVKKAPTISSNQQSNTGVAFISTVANTGEAKNKFNKSASQSNFMRIQLRKSITGRRCRPNQAQMVRLYCSLNLDKLHIQRFNQQLTILQKQAADKLYKEMLRRNQHIQAELTNFTKRCQCRQQQNMVAKSHNNILMVGEDNSENKVLGKKNLNVVETPTKLTINQNSSVGRQKTLSSQQKRQSQTVYNNWLPKPQPPRKLRDDQPPTQDSNYNFCLKESNKIQQHRRLRRLHQQNDTIQQFNQNRSTNQPIGRSSFPRSIAQDFVRILI